MRTKEGVYTPSTPQRRKKRQTHNISTTDKRQIDAQTFPHTIRTTDSNRQTGRQERTAKSETPDSQSSAWPRLVLP